VRRDLEAIFAFRAERVTALLAGGDEREPVEDQVDAGQVAR
jgi:hypothetical protein